MFRLAKIKTWIAQSVGFLVLGLLDLCHRLYMTFRFGGVAYFIAVSLGLALAYLSISAGGSWALGRFPQLASSTVPLNHLIIAAYVSATLIYLPFTAGLTDELYEPFGELLRWVVRIYYYCISFAIVGMFAVYFVEKFVIPRISALGR